MMWNNDYVWVETLKYVKCPVCGKVAVIDTGKILTSMPPKYQWHCKHCNGYGYLLCSETDKFESVVPSKEDKELYDPQPKFEMSTASSGDLTVDGSKQADLDGNYLTIEGDTAGSTAGSFTLGSRYRKCQICGKTFACGSCMSTGMGPDTDKYMCDTCAEKLKRLLYGEI